MNKNITESIDLANSIKRSLYDVEEVEIVLCPPFTSLSDVNEIVLESNIKLGAQDVYWEKEGAFTGEVSSRHAEERRMRILHSGPFRKKAILRRD